MFNALLVDHTDSTRTARVQALEASDLPEGDVEVEVLYSSLNYKDALAVTGRGKIIRGDFPFVPGIDLVGRVVASEVPEVAPGDVVIQTGWGLGETHWGGYAGRQRVWARHLVPLPEGLTPLDAMVIGTAGFTAMLAVQTLEEHGVTPDRGEVVVTGASGGVGSFAVALLARAGYHVVASTGSASAHTYLTRLGATRIIPRDTLGQGPQRPLDSARWAGAVDAVGGATLAAILSTLDRHGCVAACGLAGGAELHTTVFPFILRGVVLAGIDSNTCPNDRRRQIWKRLAEAVSEDLREQILARIISLEAVPEASEAVLAGRVQGRIVVDPRA
ncbi:oxidoreductase [Rhodothermaceae bacterium RA]|nr:oxidoreductase [Rhodothermaceae bacterium RA]